MASGCPEKDRLVFSTTALYHVAAPLECGGQIVGPLLHRVSTGIPVSAPSTVPCRPMGPSRMVLSLSIVPPTMVISGCETVSM